MRQKLAVGKWSRIFRGRRHKKGRPISQSAWMGFEVALGFLDLVLHPITLSFEGNRFGMVEEAIQNR